MTTNEGQTSSSIYIYNSIDRVHFLPLGPIRKHRSNDDAFCFFADPIDNRRMDAREERGKAPREFSDDPFSNAQILLMNRTDPRLFVSSQIFSSPVEALMSGRCTQLMFLIGCEQKPE